MERHHDRPRRRLLGRALKRFATTRDGQSVDAITLSGHGLGVTILTYGAIIQDVRLDGVARSLTIGSSDLADYEGAMQYFGCVVAPVVNRLKDARAKIGGKVYTFDANLSGRHTLHSGSIGAHNKIWQVDKYDRLNAKLSLSLPHGHGGFPGNRTVSATFEIIEGPALCLTLTTTTDAPSIANATNHSYWNLDGSDDFTGHQLSIAADHVLPTDSLGLVTGDVAPVENTLFDFRAPTGIAPDAPAFDHTFCVAQNRRELTPALTLTGASGLSMHVATTEPGIHIYDARDGGYRGIAIEAQGWPDAPNNPHFPQIDVTPAAPVVQITEWRFSRS